LRLALQALPLLNLMAEVKRHAVSAEEEGMRLDRWFKVHFPQVTFAYLNKLTRTGQVRVGTGRVKTNTRLKSGEEIRIPPLAFDKRPADVPKEDVVPLSKEERRLFQSMVIHEDRDIFVLNKPAGFAVQGGTKTFQHLDGLLMGLGAELGERPLLVHRLDRDTSGVIVVAKRRAVAASLGRLFATRTVQKTYWALTKGVPKPLQGKIDVALIKVKGPEGDRMRASRDGEEADEQMAMTQYAVIDKASNVVAWLSLKPMTGRQHQLRAHCAYIGTPILGDNKYGGNVDLPESITDKLHLHARRLVFPHPRGGEIDITAPLPPHMIASFKSLGFDATRYDGDNG
jgi:23S rRNA pseudouridine955/2504/2580 synthase